MADLEPQFIRHVIVTADPCHGRTLADGSVQWGGWLTDAFDPVATLSEAHGIEFLCPLCFEKNGGNMGTHGLHVFFTGSPVPDHLGTNSAGKAVRWSVTGSTYEDISLSPSILLQSGCGWHGFITNGVAIDAG